MHKALKGEKNLFLTLCSLPECFTLPALHSQAGLAGVGNYNLVEYVYFCIEFDNKKM